MLAHCANASCGAPFRHLHEGRLFLLEAEQLSDSSNTKAEYFWLCAACSKQMTLCLTHDGTVITTTYQETVNDDLQGTLAMVSRNQGLLPHRVNFLRSSSATFRRVVENPVNASATLPDWEQRQDTVAAASSCPVCSALVVGYRTNDHPRTDRPEDWGFVCICCGIEFTVAQEDLMFHSVPKQWLSADTHAV